MTDIVHVLAAPRALRIATWIVRSDRCGDIHFTSLAAALVRGRELAQELADRGGSPTTLRIWQRKQGPKDETVQPANVVPPHAQRRQQRS